MSNKVYLIALDDGHGANTPGKRTPPLKQDLYINNKLVRKKGETIRENEFNKAVVNYLEKALKRCGFNVLLVAPDDTDVSLKTRVSRANTAKADAYISKHYNAASGYEWQTKAKGPVTIIHKNCSSTSKTLAKNVHSELVQLHKDHKCTDYGVRTDIDMSGCTLYVLKNTKMPAILTESGFMDFELEAFKMLDPEFQKADAEATCKGICKTFNVKYVEPNMDSTKYIRVLVDDLNIRKTPSWDDSAICGTVQKGEVFTIVDKLKVGNAYMYKLKSGYFITASEKYVETITKL